MTEYTQCWEQWVGSTARPVERIKYRARVTKRDGRNWITFPDEITGRNVIVEMPDNAPTKHCDHGRHDHCAHRLARRLAAENPLPALPPGSSGLTAPPRRSAHSQR